LQLIRLVLFAGAIGAASLIVAACTQPLYRWPSLRELSNQDEIHNFNRRVAIEVDNAARPGGEPSEDLYDVPVAVILEQSKIKVRNLADEPEIRFYDEDLTLLAHEVEQWDPDDSSLVWVKVPRLPKNGSAIIYLYYDYGGDQLSPSPTDVFSNNYAGVWHFSDTTSGFYRDSSGNGRHGSLSGGMVSAFVPPVPTAGKLGGALEYTDDDMGVSIPALSESDTTEITISMWVAVRGWTVAGRFFYRSNFDAYMASSTGKLQVEMKVDESPPVGSNIVVTKDNAITVDPSDPEWTLFHFPWDGSIPAMPNSPEYVPFQDGRQIPGALSVGGTGTAKGDAGEPMSIGNVHWTVSPQSAPEALFDEVRISTVVRSPHWIYIQYKSMSDALLSFGAEELL